MSAKRRTAIYDKSGALLGQDATQEVVSDPDTGLPTLKFDLGGPYLAEACVVTSIAKANGNLLDLAPDQDLGLAYCFLPGQNGPATKYG